MSDIDIQQFFPIFAQLGVPVAFLVPTPNGFEKAIMDATSPVRELLLSQNIHDYEKQGQGPDNKVIVQTFFVNTHDMTETTASLYRPITKQGDPRIWFSNLRKYCVPCNLLALVVFEKRIYVINLSNEAIYTSLMKHEYVYDFLFEIAHQNASISEELRQKIQLVHDRGFLRSITPGDPGVGDTLENALGINRNNSKSPDYKGIELKATRLTRNGKERQETRSTLFTKVPDLGMTYKELVDNFGKVQTPKGQTIARLQIYDTLRASRKNSYDLLLRVDSEKDHLDILHQIVTNNSGSPATVNKAVSAWYLHGLKQILLAKHHETFWVKAVSENRNGIEYFRYDRILHTKNPNVSLLEPLIETDKITVDLAAHYKPDGSWRDHGVLFKMLPHDLPLLLGDPVEYDLTL